MDIYFCPFSKKSLDFSTTFSMILFRVKIFKRKGVNILVNHIV